MYQTPKVVSMIGTSVALKIYDLNHSTKKLSNEDYEPKPTLGNSRLTGPSR